MMVSDLVKDLESVELDFDETTSMDSSQFYRLCISENYKMPQYQQIRILQSYYRRKSRTSNNDWSVKTLEVLKNLW